MYKLAKYDLIEDNVANKLADKNVVHAAEHGISLTECILNSV